MYCSNYNIQAKGAVAEVRFQPLSYEIQGVCPCGSYTKKWQGFQVPDCKINGDADENAAAISEKFL